MIAVSPNDKPEVAERLIDCSLIEAVDRTAKGHLRLQTNFRYPDGSAIDLFIKKRNDLLDAVEPVLLTDFGNTSAWLSNLQIYPRKSQRRNAFMTDVLDLYGVKNSSGALEISVEPSQVASGLIKLGQSCLRLADLYYTLRLVAPGRFTEEFEEILTELNFEYSLNDQISGRLGNTVKVDFRVMGRRQDTAVMMLPSDKYSYQAKQRAEHVFTVFSDLVEWPGQKLAALDDRAATYNAIDLERVKTIATLVPVFSDQNSLEEILRAA